MATNNSCGNAFLENLCVFIHKLPLIQMLFALTYVDLFDFYMTVLLIQHQKYAVMFPTLSMMIIKLSRPRITYNLPTPDFVHQDLIIICVHSHRLFKSIIPTWSHRIELLEKSYSYSLNIRDIIPLRKQKARIICYTRQEAHGENRRNLYRNNCPDDILKARHPPFRLRLERTSNHRRHRIRQSP